MRFQKCRQVPNGDFQMTFKTLHIASDLPYIAVGQFKLRGVLVNGLKVRNYRRLHFFVDLAIDFLSFIWSCGLILCCSFLAKVNSFSGFWREDGK